MLFYSWQLPAGTTSPKILDSAFPRPAQLSRFRFRFRPASTSEIVTAPS